VPGFRNLLSFLFGLQRSVGRRSYLVTGVLLMALKLGGDLLVLHFALGRTPGLWEFLSLLRLSQKVPLWALQGLMLWALPFAWIGLSMSARRAIDAGLSPWVGLLFCVPLLNFLVMIGLCLPPSRPPRTPALPGSRSRSDAGLRAVGASLLVAMAMAILAVLMLKDYGIVLFAGTPLGMGVVAGYTFNRPTARSIGSQIRFSHLTRFRCRRRLSSRSWSTHSMACSAGQYSHARRPPRSIRSMTRRCRSDGNPDASSNTAPAAPDRDRSVDGSAMAPSGGPLSSEWCRSVVPASDACSKAPARCRSLVT